jgi:hypothetical protein
MPARHLLLAIACAALTGGAVTPARGDPMPPEDPVKGAKSTQQWREHMAAEDHERMLFYDRDRLPQHRAVLKLLVAARARYDRAKTKAAVLTTQKRVAQTVDDVRRRVTQIDHWGTNSNLLADYDAYLKALSEAYPAARVASFDGHPDALDTIRRDLDQRTRHIKDWLSEAAAAKDE